MKLLDIKNPFGAPVYHEENVSSTFDIARKLAGENAAHGTVITADFQEAGRGRQGRSWITEKGKNLLFTILLRYGDFSSVPKALTLRTGLAVSLGIDDALDDALPAMKREYMVEVKWPNDCMIGSRKIAGILAESDGANVYIGVGINVAQREFPPEYRAKAGSLIQFFPCLNESFRFFLLEKILLRLYKEIEQAVEENSWQDRLSDRLYKKNEIVTFIPGAPDSEHTISGVLSGIGQGGELLLIPEGETGVQAFSAGELRVYEEPAPSSAGS